MRRQRSRSLSSEIWRFYLLVDTLSVALAVAAIFIIDAFQLFPSSQMVALARAGVGVLILLLGSFASRKFIAQIFGPLQALSRGTREIERGNYSVQVENRNPNSQVGRLITDFNHMAKELGNVEIFRKDFINNFSHEFKTPIASISGFAQRLQAGGLPPEKQKEYIDIIALESRRLAALSSNVLLLSKYEHQDIVPDQTLFSLDEQLRLCILARETEWTQKHLQLQLDLQPVTLLGNEDMLSQVWDNLLSNAIKFSRENGMLSVSCCRRGGQVLVQVRDTGMGMEPETLKHAFDKFYQGDASHKFSGNGLGLSIVKRILDLCGGDIALFSSPGRGTTATVTLPARQTEEAPA